MGIVVGLLQLIVPLVTGVLLDTVTLEAERNQLWQLTLALFAWIAFINLGNISAGVLPAFHAASGQFLVATLVLSTSLISVLSMIPYFKKTTPIFTTLPEVDTGKSDPDRLSCAIELNGVQFRYRPTGPLILKRTSLRIQPFLSQMCKVWQLIFSIFKTREERRAFSIRVIKSRPVGDRHGFTSAAMRNL